VLNHGNSEPGYCWAMVAAADALQGVLFVLAERAIGARARAIGARARAVKILKKDAKKDVKKD